jgi:hypothetical protein
VITTSRFLITPILLGGLAGTDVGWVIGTTGVRLVAAFVDGAGELDRPWLFAEDVHAAGMSSADVSSKAVSVRGTRTSLPVG